MKKLNIAIIGQGRSGKDIHGKYLLSGQELFSVKYVVEFDERRKRISEKLYPGCKALGSYKELFDFKDIDLVVNASYSEMHYAITKDLLQHKCNVLLEKPFARNYYECDDLIKTAKENNAILAVFQQTFFAPYYNFTENLIKSGVLGEILQISIRFNGFSRRWDWQTLQKRMGGSAYNTGPHPIGIALGLLDFDENVKVLYSKLDTALTSGDAEDYVKMIMTAQGRPVVDLEINSTDAYSDYNIKLQGKRGTYICTPTWYKCNYIVEGENPVMAVVEGSLQDEEGNPLYCFEDLKTHEESGEFNGTAFDVGTQKLYENLYDVIANGKELIIKPEMSRQIINMIEVLHAQNPLEKKF